MLRKLQSFPFSARDKAKVSIIIPCKGNRGFLAQAIESAKRQFYSNTEIILSQSGKGVSFNLNKGIKKATGDFIKYLCDDDTLPADSISESVKAIQSGDYDFIHGMAYNFYEKPEFSCFHTPGCKNPTLQDLMAKNHIHGGTLMYRRDVFERFGMFDETLWTAEEFEFNLRLLSMGARIGYCDHILYNYRIHPGQKSIGNKDAEHRARRSAAIREIKSRYRK